MWRSVSLLALSVGLGVAIRSSYLRWQRLTERERFLLGMKEASTPQRMHPEEKKRLSLLHSPWWAIWRWLPELWRQ